MNFVWLASCKTGFISTTQAFTDLFGKPKTQSLYYCTWNDDKGNTIHKIYYPHKSSIDILKNIINPIYILIIRDPFQRVLSMYNYCYQRKWTQEVSFEKFLQKIKHLYQQYNPNQFDRTIVEKKISYLVDHTRPLFENIKQLNINPEQINHVIRLEHLNEDLSKFIRENLFIQSKEIIIPCINSSKKRKTTINLEEKNIILSLIQQDIELYNYFIDKHF